MAQDEAAGQEQEFDASSKADVAAVGGCAGARQCGDESNISVGGEGDAISVHDAGEEWGWRLHDSAVRPAPAFLPLDPSCTRRVHLAVHHSIEEVTLRISGACQQLSIYGAWDDASATTSLSSMDRVEMDVAVYLAGADAATSRRVVLVEAQRRKGDVVAFHNYRRRLLDAAERKPDKGSCDRTDGPSKTAARWGRCSRPRASLGRPSLNSSSILRQCIARPLPSGDMPRLTSIARPSPLGKTSRPSSMERGMDGPSNISRPSSISRPLPSGKMTRPQSIARPSLGRLSRPTLNEHVIVPDDTPEKALKALGTAASLMKKDRVDAQRIGLESLELLTNPLMAEEETATIASRVVLLGTAREDDHKSNYDSDMLFDESAELGIRETVLETIANGADCGKKREPNPFRAVERNGIEKEFADASFSLCLTILSNALRTVGEGVSRRFVADANSAFGCDVLSSLLCILGEAKANPHDACYAARCLSVLFKACGDVRGDRSAKRVVTRAIEVGRRSHAELADASQAALMALNALEQA